MAVFLELSCRNTVIFLFKSFNDSFGGQTSVGTGLSTEGTQSQKNPEGTRLSNTDDAGRDNRRNFVKTMIMCIVSGFDGLGRG